MQFRSNTCNVMVKKDRRTERCLCTDGLCTRSLEGQDGLCVAFGILLDQTICAQCTQMNVSNSERKSSRTVHLCEASHM